MKKLLPLLLLAALATACATEPAATGAASSDVTAKKKTAKTTKAAAADDEETTNDDDDDTETDAGAKTKAATPEAPAASAKMRKFSLALPGLTNFVEYGDAEANTDGSSTGPCHAFEFSKPSVTVTTDANGNVSAIDFQGASLERSFTNCANSTDRPDAQNTYTFEATTPNAKTVTLTSGAANVPATKNTATVAVAGDGAILTVVLERTDATRPQDKFTLILNLVLTEQK